MPKGKTKTADTELSGVTVDVPNEGDTYPAKVMALKVLPASEIFGEKAKDPERPTIQMAFEGPGGVNGKANLSAPGITSDGKVIARNPKSNLYKFVKKYRKGPHVGQSVEVSIDKDGFYRLVIE